MNSCETSNCAFDGYRVFLILLLSLLCRLGLETQGGSSIHGFTGPDNFFATTSECGKGNILKAYRSNVTGVALVLIDFFPGSCVENCEGFGACRRSHG